MGDKYGRKKLFWFGMALNWVLYSLLLICKNFWFMNAIWFGFGMSNSIRINIGYVFLVEMMPKKAQTSVTSLWNTQEALIYVFATFYFWKISQHWFWYCFIGYIWQILSVLLLYFIPESPRYLVSIGKLSEAKSAFETIAKWNRTTLVWEEEKYAKPTKARDSSKFATSAGEGQVHDSENGSIKAEESVVPPFSFYWKQRKYAVNLMLMSLVWLATSFGYYLILSLVNTFDKVYITAFTSSASEIAAYIISGLFYERIGVKLSLVLSFAVSTIGGVLILAWGL